MPWVCDAQQKKAKSGAFNDLDESSAAFCREVLPVEFWEGQHLVCPPPPFFLKGGGVVNFDYLPLRGGSEENKKWGGSMVQGQVLLKVEGGWEGGWHFSYLIFSRFIIFVFKNYFTLCKIVLCIKGFKRLKLIFDKKR